MIHFANFVVRDKYVLIVLKMHDHVIYLIIKAIENNKFSKAIAIIEVLQEEYEKRQSNDKNYNNIRE